MFDKIFVSPKAKRIEKISMKHRIYELPHELMNDLTLRTLGNKEVSRRSQNFMNRRLRLNLAPKIKILSILAKNSSKIKLNFPRSVLFHRKTTVCLRHLGQDSLCKQYFASKSPQGPFKFDMFKNFGNSKAFNTVLA